MKNYQKSELTKQQKGLLLALCLGDGCLRKPHPKTKGVQLEIGHSIKQLDYCTYKRDLVYEILGGVKMPKIGFKKSKLKGYETEYQSCRFTKTHDYFIYLRRLLYPNGRKTITREILDMLDARGLAIWYMDDGSCYYKYSEITGEPIMIDLRISTHCFTSEEHDVMVEYFKSVWNINFYKFYSKTRDCYCLRANKVAALKFIDLVKPFVIQSMQYKCIIKSHERETSDETSSDDDIV